MPVDNLYDQGSLSIFVDKLIEEKGLKNLDSKIVQKAKEETLVKLTRFIQVKLISLLPDDKLQELERYMESNADESDTQKFFNENIPDIQTKLAEILLEFRSIYLGVNLK